MIISPSGPGCDCGAVCHNISPSPTSAPDRVSNLSRQVAQDIASRNSFFRLSSEIRAKIYFLSTRPDCQHSFSASEACEKRHIHQSKEGRKSAWKWLVLCRQTWTEATAYMPIVSHDFVLSVSDANCARCHYTEGNPPEVKDSTLHAEIQPRLGSYWRNHEIWLARSQNLTLKIVRNELDYRYPEGEYQNPEYVARLLHNLRSMVAFIDKMKDLRHLTIEINVEIGSAIETIADIREQVQQLFNVLKRPKRPFAVGVQIRQETLTLTSKGSSTRQTSTPTGAEAMLECASTAGFETSKINIFLIERTTQKISLDDFPQHDNNDLFNFAESLVSPSEDDDRWGKIKAQEEKVELEWRGKIGSSAMWKTALFDEDFANMAANVDEYRSDGGSGPTYTIMHGCMIYEESKYKKADDFMPLYFEEDFFLGSDTAQVEYTLIPECSICRSIFATHSQVETHDRACIRDWAEFEKELEEQTIESEPEQLAATALENSLNTYGEPIQT